MSTHPGHPATVALVHADEAGGSRSSGSTAAFVRRTFDQPRPRARLS